jgi:hypothetical protein
MTEQAQISTFLRKRKQREGLNDLWALKKAAKVVESRDESKATIEIASCLALDVPERSQKEIEISSDDKLENIEKYLTKVPEETQDLVGAVLPVPNLEVERQRAHIKYRGLISDILPLPLKYIDLSTLYEAMEISFEFCRSRKEHCLYDKIKKSVENTAHK